jgi:sugar/nucleoside kinase (ribokinase family)
MGRIKVYGIGNPLIDIIADVNDNDLDTLGLNKGTMHLIDVEERTKILQYIDQLEKSYSCGGSCPNTIIALAGLGIKSALGGKIGNKEHSKIYEEQLIKNNVISELKSAEGATGSSIILVTPDSERTMNTYLGNCQHYSPIDVNTSLIEEADYLYFTGYMWDTELQKNAILKAISFAEQHNTHIIFDVADPFAVNRYRDDFLELIKTHGEIVFANQEEAKIFFNEEDPHICVEKLSEICNIAVVKIGSKGSLIKEKGQPIIHIPANKVISKDTTGAGDMFAAGFIFGLAKDYSIEEAGICASYLASQIILQHGAQFSLEKQKELFKDLEKEHWNYLKTH